MEGMTKTDIDETVEPQPSDAQLITEVKKGRRESFDQLVLRHQRRVYAITYRMTSNHDDADDLAQETFLAAYRALERFDQRQSFIAYLSRIAINLSINHLRRRKRWLKIQSQKQRQADQEMMTSR
jgi:RNA polymerase sigma-70 factor (ECF subfamily)